MSIRLSTLLQGIADVPSDRDIQVSGLSLDSRSLRPGEIFVAVPGRTGHGLDHAAAALGAGAALVLADPAGHAGAGVPQVFAVPHLRAHLGTLADRLHHAPSASLTVIGVTGTNGKTSTVQLLAQALDHLGHRSATIGTLGAGMVGAVQPGSHTTPDVLSVHDLLAGFRDAGASHVAMEVSSHALDQGRVDGVRFAVAVFTNLSRDHLDYHADMADYAAAKARLFATPGLRHALFNVDDAEGRRLAAHFADRGEPSGAGTDPAVLGFGFSADAEVRGSALDLSLDGISFDVATPWGTGRVRSRLLGAFNAHNLLAVIAGLGVLGHALDEVLEAVARLAPVRGRMNRIGGSGRPLVVVDYAHSPDALEKALASLRGHTSARLLCVFGCGGERDRGKRPIMGRIAERLADKLWITDDNPRGEDGDRIVAQILDGLAHPARAVVERDRARAIADAVADAGGADIVLIAGKGHETWQERGGERLPFDDLEHARRALEVRPC